MAEKRQTGEVPVLRAAGRTLLRQKQLKRRVPEPITHPGADVIDFEDAKRRRGRKGNEFKPGYGKGKGMVEDKISENEEQIMKLRKIREEKEKAGEEVPSWVITILEALEAEEKGETTATYSRSEMLGMLGEIAKNFDSMKGLLELPDKLYMHQGEKSKEYSEKEDDGSVHLYSQIRTNAELPKATETVFSIGLIDSGQQTYFFLCDPRKRILVVEQLLNMYEGSWDRVAQSLKGALDMKRVTDETKEKYNFVVSNMGNVSVY